MSEILKTDPKVFRSCILYEFLHGSSVETAYANVSKVVEKIDYVDFEFWFYRFFQGNFDLDYDRSSDPKKPKSFSDMPMDIVENIADYLNLLDRLIVRKVSHGFRTAIDNRTPFRVFAIEMIDDVCYLKASPCHQIIYRKMGKDKCMVSCGESKKTVKKGNYVEMAVEHMKVLLSNPDVRLHELAICKYPMTIDKCDREDLDKMMALITSTLESINHLIHTSQLSIAYHNETHKILRCLKPRTLEIIDCQFGLGERFEKIVRTDQWNQAKRLFVRNRDMIIIKHISHFQEIGFQWFCVTLEDVIRLREALFKSATFECGYVQNWNEYDIESVQNGLGPHMFRIPNAPEWRSFPIPDSDGFLDFKIDYWGLQIKKSF